MLGLGLGLQRHGIFNRAHFGDYLEWETIETETYSIEIQGDAGSINIIRWGDGVTELVVYDGTVQTLTHTYSSVGVYTVGIKYGNFTHLAILTGNEMGFDYTLNFKLS